MPENSTTAPNKLDKVLSWSIVVLTAAVFGYGMFLAWGNGDYLLVVLSAVALVVSLTAAIRWRPT